MSNDDFIDSVKMAALQYKKARREILILLSTYKALEPNLYNEILDYYRNAQKLNIEISRDGIAGYFTTMTKNHRENLINELRLRLF